MLIDLKKTVFAQDFFGFFLLILLIKLVAELNEWILHFYWLQNICTKMTFFLFQNPQENERYQTKPK